MKNRDRRYPTNPDRKSTDMTKLIVSEFVSGPLEEARKLKETASPGPLLVNGPARPRAARGRPRRRPSGDGAPDLRR